MYFSQILLQRWLRQMNLPHLTNILNVVSTRVTPRSCSAPENECKATLQDFACPLAGPEVSQSISQPVQVPLDGTTTLRHFWVICICMHVADNSSPVSPVSDCFRWCFRFCWEGIVWQCHAKRFLYASLTEVLWVAAVSAVMNVTKADPTTYWFCCVIANK